MLYSRPYIIMLFEFYTVRRHTNTQQENVWSWKWRLKCWSNGTIRWQRLKCWSNGTIRWQRLKCWSNGTIRWQRLKCWSNGTIRWQISKSIKDITLFNAGLQRFKDICYLGKLSQGCTVQHSQCCHSTTNINLYKRILRTVFEVRFKCFTVKIYVRACVCMCVCMCLCVCVLCVCVCVCVYGCVMAVYPYCINS